MKGANLKQVFFRLKYAIFLFWRIYTGIWRFFINFGL